MPYYLISGTEVREITPEEVSDMAAKGQEFLGEIEEIEHRFWGRESIIIKGEIVQPRLVKKLIQYELP